MTRWSIPHVLFEVLNNCREGALAKYATRREQLERDREKDHDT